MLNIKSGMFVSHGSCSIYFEVKEILENFLICASRDPKSKTELVFLDNVSDVVEKPISNQWIKLNREKGFYDKFYPEGWVPTITKVVKSSELKENDTIITEKGVCVLTKKLSPNKWKMQGNQKTFSKEYALLLVQTEKSPVY